MIGVDRIGCIDFCTYMYVCMYVCMYVWSYMYIYKKIYNRVGGEGMGGVGWGWGKFRH